MPHCFDFCLLKEKEQKTLHDSLDGSSNTYLFKWLTGGCFEERPCLILSAATGENKEQREPLWMLHLSPADRALSQCCLLASLCSASIQNASVRLSDIRGYRAASSAVTVFGTGPKSRILNDSRVLCYIFLVSQESQKHQIKIMRDASFWGLEVINAYSMSKYRRSQDSSSSISETWWVWDINWNNN